MHVLHVLHSLDLRSGGPSHALRAMVQEQVRQGLQVSVLATDAQAVLPAVDSATFRRQIFTDPAFEHCELILGRRSLPLRAGSRLAISSECVRWLRQNLTEGTTAISVVHIHGVFSHLTWASAKVAARARVPYIIRPAGSLDGQCIAMGRTWLKNLTLRVVEIPQLRRAACVHATSEAERASIIRLAPGVPVRVVPHGIDVPPEMADGPPSDSAKNQSSSPTILYLSRITAKKRADLLVRAFALLGDTLPGARLVLAGSDDGYLSVVRQTIAKLGVSDRVELPGFLAGAAKAAAYRRAAVFVLPSLHENHGVAVLEAMAHGVPVVVTRGVASHRYVEDAQAGIVVDDTPEAIAAGIRRVLSNGPASVGPRGREYVRTHFSWPSIAAQLHSIYVECAAAGRACFR